MAWVMHLLAFKLNYGEPCSCSQPRPEGVDYMQWFMQEDPEPAQCLNCGRKVFAGPVIEDHDPYDHGKP